MFQNTCEYCTPVYDDAVDPMSCDNHVPDCPIFTKEDKAWLHDRSRVRQYYILKDRKVSKAERFSLLEWIPRRISSDVAQSLVGDLSVETIFTGEEERVNPKGGVPHTFETSIRRYRPNGGWNGRGQECYTTWEEAKKGHEEIVKLLRKRRLNKESRRSRVRGTLKPDRGMGFDFTRFKKIVGLFASPNQNEANNAREKATSILEKAGKTWEEVLR